MLVKVVCIIIVARVLDVLILTVKIRQEKKRPLLRLALLGMITTGSLASLWIELPIERKAISPKGAQQESTRLAKAVIDGIIKQEASLKIDKIPYLTGKRVAVIGDSITELDGHEVAKVGKIVGYQEAFRQQGALVTTYGYGGATYSLSDEKIAKRKHSSLYEKVVTDKMEFKEIDIVTLFGGTNDVGNGYELGESDQLDTRTAIGGLKGIIEYIQGNNPKAQIFIFTPVRRVGQKENQKLEELTNKIIKVSKSYGLPMGNLFLSSGITLENSQEFLYDGLHPNSQGMALIGQEMVTVIEANRK